jgi:peptidyl-prolyl cis-trans isomerase D
MMTWMHRISTSWVASIFMGVLALSFVVWGIADVFTGVGSTAVATVGSTEITSDSFTRSYRNFLRNQGRQMGMDITPDMAQKMGLGNVALQQLISRTALDNAVDRMGLTTSDAALSQSVRALPAFHGVSGQFDHGAFLQAIQNNGYDEKSFLSEMRSDMSRQQLTAALETGFALPRGYAEAIFLFASERRAVDYVVVAPDAVGPIAPPSDTDLAAYVKDHPANFSTPEYRQVEYAQIGPPDVANEGAITDAMIAQDYAAHKSLYDVPEKRDIQQIEFATQADATAARAQITGAKTFDTLAASMKIKPADLSLGVLTKADLADPHRADAAFALPLNEVSQPVQSAVGGYVLMRVTAITPGVQRSLDTVKGDIRKNLALAAAASKMTDMVNAFEDSRSGGADIATAAKKAGMKSGKLASIDKNGLAPDGSKPDGVPADPEFFTTAFTQEVGDDSDPFPAKSGEYYAIKVDGVTPPKLKPLDQVRELALTAWNAQQRQSALAKRAAELTAKAIIAKDLTGIAKDMKVPVQKSQAIGRGSSDTTFSAAMVQKIFEAPQGGIVEAPQAAGGNYIIAKVSGVAHSQPGGPQFAGGQAQLSQQAASDLSVSFANASRLREGVKVNQQLLQSALGQQ